MRKEMREQGLSGAAGVDRLESGRARQGDDAAQGLVSCWR